MENKIVFATGNPHKLQEVNEIAKNSGIQFILPPEGFDPDETGKTFEQNSLIKAREAARISHKISLADDSGLCVEALNGEPGLKSARYAPTNDERIDKLLFNMEGIKNRSAEFVCAMVVVDKNGQILFKTQEKCKGRILEKRTGVNGFGYDPVFFVEGINKGMAELSDVEKSKISHRARALNNVLMWLKNEYTE